ncbi:hypothetical protein ACFOLG_07285 [Vogesella facilis]|uniref:Uncharacterized protein n=1 Tax=Vogesella facilis TaxID=1655232 RepID=A0ABV7RCC2_9NEIS
MQATPERPTDTHSDTDMGPQQPAAQPRHLHAVPERSGNQRYQYYTERDMTRILTNLDTLRREAFAGNQDEGLDSYERPFPSVCLIGLGRCGSNIALDVATLVYNARKFYLNEFGNEEKPSSEQDFRPRRWIKRTLLSPQKTQKPAFLIEPMVMLGDLDKDIKGRIRFSHRGEQGAFLNDYSKMRIMDLAEVHAGGAGNAPILGQYLAKIILNKDTQSFSDEDWKLIHAYLIDSCGIRANQSRLYFYIFSAGGGTGSGMASEFGLAQQYAYMSKTFETRVEPEGSSSGDEQGFVFEPIFTSGICILPNISGQHVEGSEALHINAGRLLCKYLSEEWDFSYNFDNEEAGAESVMRRIRPWNAMMLISNDIMRYAEETDKGSIEDLDVNAMERHANQYISQQIFNILTAQAVTTDYDENYFHRAGIDIGETIRLDANDLFMSLAGPVAVAYAESVVGDPLDVNSSSKFNIDDLFFRSIDLPHFNPVTQAIEGISLLPIESDRYRTALNEYKESGYDPAKLNELFFFRNCSSVVAILSLPKGYKLSYMDLNRLKQHLNGLFPSTTLKRYALVIGASANLSLTTLVAKSPCLSDDFLTLIVAYIKRCFARGGYRYNDTLDNAILELITAERFDESRLEELLDEFENPAKILDTNWFAIKPMYEKKYRELIRDPKKFVSINDIRLTRHHVQKAICYLREIYRHRIGKTRVVSLNAYADRHPPLPHD